ncbi:MAG: transposase [Ignavibacteriaceae bacterium]|nr:transposase [Ignavibacteriaceae bacterium]
MKYNPEERHRKSIRLREYDYSEPNWYYVTICTYDRKNLFGDIKNSKMVLNDFGKFVNEEWLRTKELRKNIDLDEYVIMPNHFHGILIIERRDTARCVPTSINDKRKFGEMQPGSLSAIIRSFKSAVTKRINELKNVQGKEVWQKGFYEHIIRNEHDLYNIRKYIGLNPFKWEIDEYYQSE